ncbi:MAG: baseplate J/gp47 family protein [Caldilineaceae bacterium]|nr:baseplate J/gp47 family protein [Caldilineaceae bacterium]MCB0138213.1 baseplate J/gp47 family protein [Caldilineaceae bacterium]
MADFGVTDTGFNLKGFDAILADSMARAQQMFGATIDLTATSPLRKILEVTSAEDSELWKWMENLYYSNFVSTALGDNLDLLGQDVGVTRNWLFAAGTITVKIAGPAPSRNYILPEGTIVVTAAPVQAFYTTDAVTLNAATPQATVTVQAFAQGPAGNIAAGALIGIDPVYQQLYLSNFGAAAVTVQNSQPFSGGDLFESDEEYRSRLLGLPRNLWTLESVRSAVLDLNGVIDVLLSDPLGGVDVSQSYFNLFNFNQRLFSSERSVGDAYFFDIVVAHEFVWPWRTTGSVPGIFERVSAAVDQVRPIGIYPNIVEANHINVGVRATIHIQGGYDQQAVLASIKQRLANDIGALKLGSNVLYSQVMCAFADQPGVVDVQQLHLRRCPPDFGRITFGAVPFQTLIIEAAIGDNLAMGATELAVFSPDSDLIDFAVVIQ